MLESCVGGTGWWNNFRVTGGLLKVTCDGFAFIEICEQKDKTTQEKVVQENKKLLFGFFQATQATVNEGETKLPPAGVTSVAV